jgi:hypothetical protein
MILALLAAGALSVVDAAAKDLRFHGVVRVERKGSVLVEKRRHLLHRRGSGEADARESLARASLSRASSQAP